MARIAVPSFPVIKARPPEWVWARANELWEIDEAQVCFAHGGAAYCPSSDYLSDDLMVHEGVHLERQEALGAYGANHWWRQYLVDPRFRLDEEVLAYGRQHAYLCQVERDGPTRYEFLCHLAGQLSSPMYGLGIDQEKARHQILTESRSYR